MSPYCNTLLVFSDKAIEENLTRKDNRQLSLESQAETESTSSEEISEGPSKYSKYKVIRPHINSNKCDAVRERFYCKLGIRRCHREETHVPAKHHRPSILSKSTKRRKRDRVHFNNKITIVPVPSHSSYSDRIRNRLWPSLQESHENIMRNSLEFASEGSNWRNVVEECNMVDNIHPIHTHIASTYLKPKGIFLLYSKIAADSFNF